MNTDPDQAGFHQVIFSPQSIDKIDFVSYFTNTSFGEAGNAWKNENGTLFLDIIVPVDLKATDFLPSENINSLKESSYPFSLSRGEHLQSDWQDSIILNIEWGKYRF